MSLACKHFGLDLTVFMVKQSYLAKPYRKVVMGIYGAQVHASLLKDGIRKGGPCKGSGVRRISGMAILRQSKWLYPEKTPGMCLGGA